MKLYDSAELEAALKRPRFSIFKMDQKLVWMEHKTNKTQVVHWLYWAPADLVIAFAIYGVGAGLKVLTASGIWVVQDGVKDFTPHDVTMVARNIGVTPRLLMGAVAHTQSKAVGDVRNQWNDLTHHSFEELRKKITEEVPLTIQFAMYKSLKKARYHHYLVKSQYSWEKAYPHLVHEVGERVRQIAQEKHFLCVDNVRVAKVGNRQHYHHYFQQFKRGCCGSYDVQIWMSGGLHHLGFNYGH